MAKLPPLARTVGVGSTFYRAGDTPSLDHARKITNPLNWEGGKVPDFDNADEPENPSKGVGAGEAAGAPRTGLAGAKAAALVTGSEGAGDQGDKADADKTDDKTDADKAPAAARQTVKR